MRKIFILLFVVISFGAVSCAGTKMPGEGSPEWEGRLPGIWVSEVGKPENLNLLNSANAVPRSETLGKKSPAEFPIDKSGIKFVIKDGRTYLRFPLDRDEHIYGFGLNFKSINQRGQIKRLHMDHYGSSDNGRTHAPVPFFVSSKKYGVMINSARYIDVYAGTGVRADSKNPPVVRDRSYDPDWEAQPYSDNLELLIPAEGVEVIMFAGESMLDVVSRFNLYCGGGFIPPKWGLGFWHRLPTPWGEQEVTSEVNEFEKRGFPLDVVGLEPGWHSKSYPCTWEWQTKRFPDPAAFVENMGSKGLEVNLWVNPFISPEGEFIKKIEPYVGTHTVWNGRVPDYTMPEARKLFREHIMEHQVNIGVSGYKVDEVDGFDVWLWPDVAQFPSGTSAEQMRSIYGNLVMDVIDEAYHSVNRRTYGLSRGINGGGVRFPYVIYNDNYSHRDFITALASSSFAGVLWTPEVRASRTSEEWLRRMQTTCLSPIAMINAWADGTKPWSFPDVYDECLKAAELRMQLLPYLYSIFSQYYFEGMPPFRALNLIEGFNGEVKRVKGKLDATDNPYETVTLTEVRDQYMAGDNILCAPVFAGEKERDVVLPPGKWYDFHTGDYIGEGEVVKVAAQLDRMPMFVRDGGIVPMIPVVRQTKEWIAGQPLEVRVYGKADGSFDLYEDDGRTFGYQNGKSTVKRLKVTGGEPSVEDIMSDGGWTYTGIDWKFMTE